MLSQVPPLQHTRNPLATSAPRRHRAKQTHQQTSAEDGEHAAECRRWKDEYDRLLLIYMADPEPEPMDLEIHFCDCLGKEKYFPGYCGMAYRTTERAVRRGSRTDPKKCPVGACENRVPCGGKYAVGVGRGISDSPRQLVNQLERDTACSTTDSRSICSSAAAARRHGPCRPLLLQGENRVLRGRI